MAEQGQNIINVIQGEFRVSKRPEDVITTILGSCVSACIYDPVRRIGGMNHFLLPGTDPRERQNIKYGAYAMEQLINALLRGGGTAQQSGGKAFRRRERGATAFRYREEQRGIRQGIPERRRDSPGGPLPRRDAGQKDPVLAAHRAGAGNADAGDE